MIAFYNVVENSNNVARPNLPLPVAQCHAQTTAHHRPISVYPGVYQSLIEIRQSEHPCGLQPAFGEQVQNIE